MPSILQGWQALLGTGNQVKVLVLIVQHPLGRLVHGYHRDNYTGSFQNYVINALASGHEQWMPIGQYCGSCDLQYKYILRVETLQWDVAVVTNLLYDLAHRNNLIINKGSNRKPKWEITN